MAIWLDFILHQISPIELINEFKLDVRALMLELCCSFLTTKKQRHQSKTKQNKLTDSIGANLSDGDQRLKRSDTSEHAHEWPN